jgi:hypothetical protein
LGKGALLNLAPVLLAASSIGPTSVYLDFRELNPSLPTTILLVVCSFAFLTLVVSTLRVWWRSDLVVIIACLVWIVLTTSGGMLNRSDSELLRIGSLSAILLLIVLLVRILRTHLVEWFKVASWLSIAITSLQIGIVSFQRPTNDYQVAQSQTTNRPTQSFFMIVVDGYGAPKNEDSATLEFLDELTKRGFSVVLDAVSNYTATYSSMSSMLSLDHRFSNGLVPLRDMFSAMQGANQVRTLLEETGLSYVHIESDWPGTRCGPTVAICVGNAFPDGLAWEVGQLSYFGPYLSRTVTSPHVVQGLRSLESIKARRLLNDTKPEFVFAHILLPHLPFQLEANCEIATQDVVLGEFFGDAPSDSEAVHRAERYFAQKACLNAKLLSMISTLPEEASVVITSDHGSDLRGQLGKPLSTWDSLDIRERFSIFHTVRLPRRCKLSLEHDLVNLVRSEIGCLVGASIDPIQPYFEISPPHFSDEASRVLRANEVLDATSVP